MEGQVKQSCHSVAKLWTFLWTLSCWFGETITLQPFALPWCAVTNNSTLMNLKLFRQHQTVTSYDCVTRFTGIQVHGHSNWLHWYISLTCRDLQFVWLLACPCDLSGLASPFLWLGGIYPRWVPWFWHCDKTNRNFSLSWWFRLQQVSYLTGENTSFDFLSQ